MEFLLQHWLAFLSLVAALGLGAAAVAHRHRRGAWAWGLYLPAMLLASFGSSALLFALTPESAERDSWSQWWLDSRWWIGFAIFLTALTAFLAALAVVFRKGAWSPPLGYVLAVAMFVGLGGFAGASMANCLRIASVFVVSLRPQAPWWLLLLLLIPLLFWASYTNLITLGPIRRWLVLGLRSALIVLIAMALAEVFARKPSDSVSVLFVWDRSYSIPPEFESGIDLRQQRVFDFINESVLNAGKHQAGNRVGVVVFGKSPRLELPPGSVPKLNFKKILSQVDSSYTDIAAAVKLGLASFPEGSGKRLVIISDGNENRGRAEEQARIAKQNGVEVDIIPIAAGRKHTNEILIERIEAPPIAEKDARLPVRVVVRSFHPEIVVARLNVRKVGFEPGKQDDKGQNSAVVKLHQGLNVFYFQQTGAKDETAFAYEATVVPLRVETLAGALRHKELPGDRIDNNEARVSVMTRGAPAVLILEGERGRHRLLVDRLLAANPSLKIVTLTINIDKANPDNNVNELQNLTKGDSERLATFLTRFDAVFLANLPAEALSEEEQKVIRSHVHDQGTGLVMIGGNQSFGAGGWQNTEVEKALPVNMELKSMKIEGKSGLVLIMHASEMEDGNAWQRKIAKLAVEKLNSSDMIGQLHWGMTGHEWHIPFQPIEGNKARILRLVDTMIPSDMPDVDPAFEKAHKELTNPEYKLGTKHIILISDGDHWNASVQAMQRLVRSKITCTTVCITSHGKDEVEKMAAIAKFTGGRAYHVKDPRELPAIYVKESRLVSQAFVHEGKFQPLIPGLREGPTDGMRDPLQALYGFVRTTVKDAPSVKTLVETPKIGRYKFPILASWQYGLGKSVAFTSDARTSEAKAFWDKDWANSEDVYTPFWGQLVRWVLRPTETGKHLFLSTEQKDGKIRVKLETLDADKMPLTDVELQAGVGTPAFQVKEGKKAELKFEQKNAGVWEAEINADEVGAYFINVQAKWKKDGKEMLDTVRAGVTIPYSPEFAEMESNAALLDRMRDLTGGAAYRDDADVLAKAAKDADVFRPVPESYANLQALWPWLVFFAGVCLLFDVALRRIAIEPEAVWARGVAYWQKLRGQASLEESLPEYIERLKSRKAQVGEAIDKQKAGTKFEASPGTKTLDAPTLATGTPAEKPKPPPKPKVEEPEEDFAARLMRAKKKAMEERDKDKK